MKLLLLSAIFQLALCDDEPGHFVGVLNDDNWKEVINEQPLALVKFYAPWCGHCRKLAPEFEKASVTLLDNEPPVKMYKIDCTEAMKTCGEYKVGSYPTLKVFRYGMSSEYKGGRTYDTIVKQMEKESRGASEEIKTVDRYRKKYAFLKIPVVLGFFSNDQSKAYKAFVLAADEVRESILFAHSFSAEVANEAGAYIGDIIMIRPQVHRNKFDNDREKYDKQKHTMGLVRNWAKKAVRGYAPILRIDDQDDFGYPQVVAIYNVDWTRDPKGTQYYRNRVMKVAIPFIEKYGWNFAVANKDAWGEFLTSNSLVARSNRHKEPIIVVFEDKQTKFIMEETFTVEAFEKYLTRYSVQELDLHIKSQEDDTKVDNTGVANKVLTSTNFAKEIDGSKDAFIYFYAPWCGHCKKLAPKWDLMAQHFKDNDNIVIGKFDGEANDMPKGYEITGYPTVFWIPKGKEAEKYNGARETDNLISFAEENASEGKPAAHSEL